MKVSQALATRRQILSAGLGAAGGALLPSLSASETGYAPTLAAQVYVWTQQLRAQKRTLSDGLEEIIAGTRRAGFSHAELIAALFLPGLRERTAGLLKKHNLSVPIVYHGAAMHEPVAAEASIAETLALAESLRSAQVRAVNFNPLPKPKREPKSDQELQVQAAALGRLATALEQKKMRLLLHHHDPEMANDAREWRHLLRHTELPLCVDVHWVLRGGQDPYEIMREAGPRLASLHLRNSQAGVWSEALGEGDIDYPKIAGYLKQTKYRGYLVVELAYEEATVVTRPLEENLRLSRAYAEETFGLV